MQLYLQVEQSLASAVQAAQGHAAIDQADRVEGALLHNTQQQGQLVVLHAAGDRQQQLRGLPRLGCSCLQVGMDQVAGVARRAQRRLQRLGAQLPPVAGVDIARLQPGGGAGLRAERYCCPCSRA